jgi:glycosyltransferase involved in cell wall biosynthesis
MNSVDGVVSPFAGRRFAFVAHLDFALFHFRHKLLARLVAAGAEVFALAPHGEYDKEWEKIGAKHIPYDLEPSSTSPLAAVGVVANLTRLFRELKPDLVQTFAVKPNVFGPVAARVAGVPTVVCSVTGRGSYLSDDVAHGLEDRVVGSVVRGLYRVSTMFADRVIFLNSDDRRLFVRGSLVSPARASMIPGEGVDTQTFSRSRLTQTELDDMRRAHGIPLGVPLVVMTARLIRTKGVLDFGAVSQRIREVIPDAHFFLIGMRWDANPAALTAAEIDQLASLPGMHLGSKIRDVAACLGSADLFMLPVRAPEGLPQSIQEAMSMGLPIVTTNMPGCTELVVEGENGFVVEPGDIEVLTARTLQLLRSPELRARMGARSRERVVNEYSIDYINARYMAVYASLLR